MKLNGRDTDAFLKNPAQMLEKGLVAVLLYGPDDGLVALARKALVAVVAEGDDLRTAQLDAANARDPAELDAALRAQGFFPGRRVVTLEGAKDALTRSIAPVLDDLTQDDAFLIVAAGRLTARSSLRKLFESHPAAAAAALWPKTLSASEAAADATTRLKAAGCKAELAPEAGGALAEALAGLDAGSAQQLIDRIALAFVEETGELGAEALAPHLPFAADAGADALIDAVVEGRAESVGPALRRAAQGGATSARIMILATRRFRDLVALHGASDGSGGSPPAGAGGPPIFGPQGRRLVAAAQRWGPKLEEALRLLFDVERRLRSPKAPGQTRPDLAMVERCLLRLAMIGARLSRR